MFVLNFLLIYLDFFYSSLMWFSLPQDDVGSVGGRKGTAISQDSYWIHPLLNEVMWGSCGVLVGWVLGHELHLFLWTLALFLLIW